MSFAEKVHARLLALESQVQALDKRLKALEPRVVARVEAAIDAVPIQVVMKRKPGRPRKEANV